MGAVIDIRRKTNKDTPIVNFQDGSVLLERDLDLLATFDLYIAQEVDDYTQDSIQIDTTGHYNAQNLRITNVAPPVNGSDVVTKAVLQYDYPAIVTVAPYVSSIEQVAAALNGGGILEQDLGFITDNVTVNPGSSSDLTVVANNIDDVVIVADNITAVNSVATNMTSVVGAVANASIAQSAAADAQAAAAQAQSIISHFTISTNDPSGGVDGDVWFKVTA